VLSKQNEELIRSIVQEAAETWSRDHGALVSEEAQMTLIDRATEHAAEVQNQLNTGEATRESILQAAISQFDAALAVAASENTRVYVETAGGDAEPALYLTDENMVAGMRWKCYWIPWC
jgi:hypothetical protein